MAQSHLQGSLGTPCRLRGLMNEKKPSEMISCRTPQSLESTCTVFNKDYNLPRPPENLDELDNNVENHAHLLADESSQNSSFLIQMFLSELQESDTSALCPFSGPMTEGETTALTLAQQDVEPESDHFCTGTETIFPQPIVCAKPCRDNSELVCNATESMLNPLDDPFVSNFTDISTLDSTLFQQNTIPSLSVNSQTSPSVPSTPNSVHDSSTLVDVQTMLTSATCENTGMFDLSECVNFLSTSVSSEFPSTPASSVPSPVSATSSTYEPSSPADSLQAATLLNDFDFSSLSTQDLQNVISTITHFEEPQSESTSYDISVASSPISVGTPALPSPAEVSKTSRKRKRSEAVDSEAFSVRSKRLSSDSSSSCASTSEDQPLTAEQKKILRREKNNVASVISRAKRRQRHKDIRARESELEAANAELREKVEWLTAETKKYRDMLLHKLSH